MATTKSTTTASKTKTTTRAAKKDDTAELQQQIATLTRQVQSLQAEVTALRSAPAAAPVPAASGDFATRKQVCDALLGAGVRSHVLRKAGLR